MLLVAAALALTLSAPTPTPAARAESPREAAARFLAARPHARAIPARHGGLAHASALREPRTPGSAEESARRFLEREGAPFGVVSGVALQRVAGGPAATGARFRRLVRGLPVFGGDVSVGWRADGTITVVNGSPELATEVAGAHRVGAGEARDAAAPDRDDVEVETGWLEFGGMLRPVHRVAHGAAHRATYTFVDAETGALLYHAARARDAAWAEPCTVAPCIDAYLVSPLAPPLSDSGANPAVVRFALQGIASSTAGTTLSGERTAVFNCAGYGLDQRDFPRACETPRVPAPGQVPVGGQTPTADPQGSFVAAPAAAQRDLGDAFAEQSAYFHIDSHSRFLDALDPVGFAPRTGTPAGGVGFIPGYVNVLDGSSPLDNAFYSPTGGPPGSSGVMIFGQGTLVDLAYDAEVLYHELTHAAIEVTAGFQSYTDTFGVNPDPDAINEGTADTFAFAHVGESILDPAGAGADLSSASCISRYFGTALGLGCLREARNERTCRGAGPNAGRNPGRTGEVHDDGEIWTGFTWDLYEAAAAQGKSFAMAQALFQALGASGPRPTFEGLAATVQQKVQEHPDLGADGARFVACTAARRDLAGCEDRTVPLYSGERAQGVVYGLLSAPAATSFAGQQYFVDVPCGATALRIQTGDSTGAGGLYVRYGRRLEFASTGLPVPEHDWRIVGNRAEVVLTAEGCTGCVACAGGQTPLGGGRWYFLPAGSTGATFELGVSISMPEGQAPPARPAFEMGACAWGGSSVPVGGTQPLGGAPPLACAAPTPAPAASAACLAVGGSRGCGCSHGSPGGLVLLAAALLALRCCIRPRPMHSFRL